MKNIFRITAPLMKQVFNDLNRPHTFAAERVGFIYCRFAELTDKGLLILAEEYLPVADEDYIKNKWVGAMIGPAAIRKAMQHAYNAKAGLFHTHMHHHNGLPGFSVTDLQTNQQMVPDFFNAIPETPHGAIVFSLNGYAAGQCWKNKADKVESVTEIAVVGSPTKLTWGFYD